MFKFLISLTLLGGLCATARAKGPTLESVLFNGGFHTEFYNAVQVDDSGGMRQFDPALTLGGGVSIPINYGWRFLPEFNWVLPRTAGSSRIIKNLLMFRADFGYDPIDWLRLRIGTSIMHLNQHGRGGSTQINNGNGTSTFHYPDENHSSMNNTLDLGIEALFTENWAMRFQTYNYFVFKEERRQLSYTLFITYYWNQ